jgi:hypothetical protein
MQQFWFGKYQIILWIGEKMVKNYLEFWVENKIRENGGQLYCIFKYVKFIKILLQISNLDNTIKLD